MSIKPIDFKTTLYNADDAGKVRENQKAHEAGVAGNATMNKNENDQKLETIQKTDPADGQTIKKEDEEEQDRKNRQKKETLNKNKKDETKVEKPKIPDGIHCKIDFRA